MDDHFMKCQMPIYRTFFDGLRCSRRESFYDRSPTYLGRKLIKYQREEETGGEKKGAANRAGMISPLRFDRENGPDRVAARRRIKRAWASTFRANSAFDDLRPRRIESLPAFLSSTLVDPSFRGSPPTVHG